MNTILERTMEFAIAIKFTSTRFHKLMLKLHRNFLLLLLATSLADFEIKKNSKNKTAQLYIGGIILLNNNFPQRCTKEYL